MSAKNDLDKPLSEEQKLHNMRHSCSHILAQAVLEMFPDAKLGIGPTIETGFYYDFDLPRTLIPEDLKILEDKMKRIIKEKQTFHRVEEPAAEAVEFLEGKGQPYKAEVVRDLMEEGEEIVSFYENKDRKDNLKFWDLCEGGHLENTGQVGAFKLTKIAGAYWRGDEKRPMLQRIYGACFLTKEELKAYLDQLEEAKKRDHKVLGPKLGLYTSSPLVGAGLPLLGPKGAVIRRELEDYLWELHKNRGYSRVYSPHIAKEDLYVQSGHAAKFGDELFRVKGKEDSFILKPMNCPHHMQIFSDNQFSYRDMPVRYFEPAVVYRDEKSGQLGGLTRVRSITQDDGHLFCRVSQIKAEVKIVCEVINEFYSTIGMNEDYWVSLSVRGEERDKYLGDDKIWEQAEEALEEAAKAIKLPYKRVEGEAAFYGPKLDFMFKDAIGREWQLATIQCDFNLPLRFELEFTNEEGEKERPVVIHRAICGSFERFMGVLIEHFVGAFPVWLAPVQVQIIPVATPHHDFANKYAQKLRSEGARVIVDDSNDSLGKRIRNAEMQKIPYMLVVGDKEIDGDNIAVRSYKTKEQFDVGKNEFIDQLKADIKERKL
ncbi:threonine--tRNA ligase [Candidatus Peregrinibacteria bacterium]|nr:threonine--tRNA ligase [Candidatus Peregrinibacteria bacterium]